MAFDIHAIAGYLNTSIYLSVVACALGVFSAAAASQEFRDCPDCPEMVVIPRGDFIMGSTESEFARDLNAVPRDPLHSGSDIPRTHMARERPDHGVLIKAPFSLGKYLVTRAEFSKFVKETQYSASGRCTIWESHKFKHPIGSGWENPGFSQTDRDPVVCVNWRDAKAFIAWMNRKLDSSSASVSPVGPYRLPSEAEWEYAARAGTRTARWWGDPIGVSNANCDGCGSPWDKKQTSPVGSFRANQFGIHDVLGNVWQWTEDCWNDNHVGAPVDGSARIDGNCEQRVLRGGSWVNEAWVLRSSERTRTSPDSGIRANYNGFRVAKTLQ